MNNIYIHTLLDKKEKYIQCLGIVEDICLYNKFQYIVMKSCYIQLADREMVWHLKAGDNKTGSGTRYLKT